MGFSDFSIATSAFFDFRFCSYRFDLSGALFSPKLIFFLVLGLLGSFFNIRLIQGSSATKN